MKAITMTTMTMIIIGMTSLFGLWSVGLFYMGLRLGLKVAVGLYNGESLYSSEPVILEQTHTGDTEPD